MEDLGTNPGYSYRQTSVGKSVSLLPTDPRTGMMAWLHLISPFEFSRKISITSLVSYIIFIIYLMYNKNKWCSGSQAAFKALGGLRSGVRPLPPTFGIFLIFFQVIQRIHKPKDHHTPFQSSQPSVRWPNLMAITWRCIMSQSQHTALDFKSQTWTFSNGSRSDYWHPHFFRPISFSLFIYIYFI